MFKKVFVCLMLAACGGGTVSNTNTDGGSDAAFNSDASGDGSAADLAVEPESGPMGFVTLSSSSNPSKLFGNASFLRDGPAFTCVEHTMGACTLYDCSPHAQGGGAPDNAGDISVTGALHAITFSPATDGYYDSRDLTGKYWNGGETLTATAVGGVVPAFTASVVAPKEPTVLTPALADPWIVDQSQSVTLTWSGLDSELMVVTLGANTTDPLEVECVFSGDAGTGTVAQSLLAMLPAGDGYFEVRGRRVAHTMAGLTYVTFRADSTAVDGNGERFTGGITLQ